MRRGRVSWSTCCSTPTRSTTASSGSTCSSRSARPPPRQRAAAARHPAAETAAEFLVKHGLADKEQVQPLLGYGPLLDAFACDGEPTRRAAQGTRGHSTSFRMVRRPTRPAEWWPGRPITRDVPDRARVCQRGRLEAHVSDVRKRHADNVRLRPCERVLEVPVLPALPARDRKRERPIW
jgi:hypothetical protein